MHHTDGRAVSRSDGIEIIDRAESAAAGHVLDNHARVSWNVASHVPGQGPCVDIVTATRPGADDEIDCLAAIEILDFVALSPVQCKQGKGGCAYNREKSHDLMPLCWRVSATSRARASLVEAAAQRAPACAASRRVPVLGGH